MAYSRGLTSSARRRCLLSSACTRPPRFSTAWFCAMACWNGCCRGAHGETGHIDLTSSRSRTTWNRTTPPAVLPVCGALVTLKERDNVADIEISYDRLGGFCQLFQHARGGRPGGSRGRQGS